MTRPAVKHYAVKVATTATSTLWDEAYDTQQDAVDVAEALNDKHPGKAVTVHAVLDDGTLRTVWQSNLIRRR